MYLSEHKKITQQIWKVIISWKSSLYGDLFSKVQQWFGFIPILFIIFINLCEENIK